MIHVTLFDVLGLAEEILQTSRSIAEVENELKTHQHHLNFDLQKQEAASQLVTKHILDDCMELLRLFGVPYVVSPSEAEAQCAQLEMLGLCDGTITEDSDVWLFGGGHVLKNFFQQDRYVTSYATKDIQQLCGLDRKKLIAVALVCGSDYTDGIMGAGPVTASEILSEFGQQCDGVTAMKNFRAWVDKVKSGGGILPGSLSNTPLRSKLRRHVGAVPDNFPCQVVVDAYLNPRVDDSSESFEWGRIDLDLLRKFALKTLNWSTQKVDDLVCPVLKKVNSKTQQSKVTDFFKFCPTSINSSQLFQSKRLNHAFSKLTSPSKQVVSHPPSTNTIKPQPKPKSQWSKSRKTQSKPSRKTGKAQPSINVRLVKEEVSLSEESDSD